MDRNAAGATSSRTTTAGPGTGSEFRTLAAGASMERRPAAHARSART